VVDDPMNRAPGEAAEAAEAAEAEVDHLMNRTLGEVAVAVVEYPMNRALGEVAEAEAGHLMKAASGEVWRCMRPCLVYPRHPTLSALWLDSLLEFWSSCESS
jgi:hypothetical protein